MEPVPKLDELPRVIRYIDPGSSPGARRFQAWTMAALDGAGALPIEERPADAAEGCRFSLG